MTLDFLVTLTQHFRNDYWKRPSILIKYIWNLVLKLFLITTHLLVVFIIFGLLEYYQFSVRIIKNHI